jgi:hypothetical protein
LRHVYNHTNTTTEDNPTVGGDLTDAGDIDPDGTPSGNHHTSKWTNKRNNR